MDVADDPLMQVRETCAWVTSQAAHVTIDPQGALALAAPRTLNRRTSGSADLWQSPMWSCAGNCMGLWSVCARVAMTDRSASISGWTAW